LNRFKNNLAFLFIYEQVVQIVGEYGIMDKLPLDTLKNWNPIYMTNFNTTPNIEPDYDINLDPGVMSIEEYYSMSVSEHLAMEEELESRYDIVQNDEKEQKEAVVDKENKSSVTLDKLIELVQLAQCQLYFVHDGEGVGDIKPWTKQPDIPESNCLLITSGAKLENLIDEYQPDVNLSEKLKVQWLDICLNQLLLSSMEREKFYQTLTKWMEPASPNELIELIQHNHENAVLVNELVTLLPSTMMFNDVNEVTKMIDFLELQLKDSYPDMLDKYLDAHQNLCNLQNEEMVLLNAIKEYAPQKLKRFEFLNVVRQYNHLSRQSIFTAPTEVRHIHMQVDNLQIYQYLGLKNTSKSEVNIWAENLVSNLFRKPEIKSYWKLDDYQYKSMTSHQKKWIISIQKDSKLNEEIFIQSFNAMLNHIRTLNPSNLLNFDFDTNQWFNNYWLKTIVENALNDDNHNNNSNNDHNHDSVHEENIKKI
jgi:hypothetical protein